MTLVVAARNDDIGIPLMLGDSLITLGSYEEANLSLPGKLPGQDGFTAETLGIFSDQLVRKVCVPHPDLCLGWAGSKIAATSLLEALQAEYPPDRPLNNKTLEALSRMRDERECAGEKLSLCGHMFERSRSMISSFTFDDCTVNVLPRFGQVFAIGSGQKVFLTEFEKLPATESFAHNTPPPMVLAAFRGISTCANMLTHEWLTCGKNYNDCFGGAYEFIIFDPQSRRFGYVDGVSSMSWEIERKMAPPYSPPHSLMIDHFMFRTFHDSEGAFVVERFFSSEKTRHGYRLERKEFCAKALVPDYGIRLPNLENRFTANIYRMPQKKKTTCDLYAYVDCRATDGPPWINLDNGRGHWHVKVMNTRAMWESKSIINQFCAHIYGVP